MLPRPGAHPLTPSRRAIGLPPARRKGNWPWTHHGRSFRCTRGVGPPCFTGCTPWPSPAAGGSGRRSSRIRPSCRVPMWPMIVRGSIALAGVPGITGTLPSYQHHMFVKSAITGIGNSLRRLRIGASRTRGAQASAMVCRAHGQSLGLPRAGDAVPGDHPLLSMTTLVDDDRTLDIQDSAYAEAPE